MDNANATAMATSPPEENRVDYRVHLPAPACSDRDAAEALLIEMRVHVRALLRAISHQRVSQGGRVDESDDGDAIVDDYGDDEHLWQVDPFALSLRKSASQTSNASATVSAMASTTTDHWELRGSTRFGDCIEDEWLIVHLLLALTSAFAGVAVELTDNDGQFLLIEAALALPSWVEPENSDGRVFLYAGNVHLVAPEDKTAAKASSPPPRDQALAMVRSPTRDTLASPSVQAAIRARTEAAVEAARDHRLRINCIVPRDVARVLACEPRWIADATEAFCARDMACTRMSHFPPATAVLTTIAITKTMYAQLASQRFHAPTPFARDPDWKALMGDGAAEECRWAELGMKIACGFEMLMTDRMYAPKTGKGASAVPSEDGDVDLSRDAKWRKLRARLQTTGYFQGQIEGSEMHTKLLLAAQQSYLASQGESIEGDDDSGNGDDMFDIHSSPQVEIPRILAQSHTAHPTDDAFDTMLEHSGRWEVRAFDDSWMRVDPAEVEQMLRERSGVDGKEVGDEAMTDRAKKNDDGVPVVPTNPATTDESQAEFDLRAMLEKFQQFLGAQSGVDGVDTDEMDPAILAQMEELFGAGDSDSEYDALDEDGIRMDDSDVESDSETPPTLGQQQHGAPLPNLMETALGTDQRLNRQIFDEYFAAMERELDGSTVADGFTRVREVNADSDLDSSFDPRDVDEDDESMSEDEEARGRGGCNVVDIDDENLVPKRKGVRRRCPVDVEANLAENLLRGFESQQGRPGPISSILGSLGVVLPRNEESSEGEDD